MIYLNIPTVGEFIIYHGLHSVTTLEGVVNKRVGRLKKLVREKISRSTYRFRMKGSAQKSCTVSELESDEIFI